MLDWLIGMAGAVAFILILFNPRSFLYGLVTLFVLRFCFDLDATAALTASAVASWAGLLVELYRNMDNQ